MKILALFLILLTLSSHALFKKSFSNNKNKNKKVKVHNEFEGTSGEKNGVSVTYGLGSNKGYILENTAVRKQIKYNIFRDSKLQR
jgi:hypothetical protein